MTKMIVLSIKAKDVMFISNNLSDMKKKKCLHEGDLYLWKEKNFLQFSLPPLMKNQSP